MNDRKHLIFAVPAFFALTFILLLSCGDKGTEPTANRAPRITSATSLEAVEDMQFGYTATATDPDSDPLTIEIHNIPSWLTLSGNSVSGTPAVQTPDTSFTIVVSDGSLADTAVVMIAVVPQVSLVSYSAEIQPIFNSNCAGSQCHIGGTANGLSLASYSSLMQGGNSGAVVIPGDPDNSIIIRRLEGAIQPQMPFGRSPLPQATIQLIRDWIAQGAHNN